jgi:dipeptidyl aminopeptidase/acylaminoacyl peptidase
MHSLLLQFLRLFAARWRRVNMPPTNSITCLAAISVVCASFSPAQTKRFASPRDCVNVRYLPDSSAGASLEIDATGTRVAYLVKEPDIDANRNSVSLYVKSLDDRTQEQGTLLLRGPDIAQIHWLEDGKHITALTQDTGQVVVSEVDAVSGERLTLVKADSDITNYSTDARGDVVVFAVKSLFDGQDRRQAMIQEEGRGYRLPFKSEEMSSVARGHIYLTRHKTSGEWIAPEMISVQSPSSGERVVDFPLSGGATLGLTLSPDGKLLLFQYFGQYPQAWKKPPSLQAIWKSGSTMGSMLVLKNLETGASSVAVAPEGASPLWLSDSRSFFVTGSVPPERPATERDSVKPDDGMSNSYLLWVEPSTGRVEEVASRDADQPLRALWLNARGDLLARTSPHTVTRFSRDEGGWRQVAEFVIPLPDFYPWGHLATDGVHIVGDYQNLTHAPAMFNYTLGHEAAEIFAKLNPLFDDVSLAAVESIHWKMPTGYDANAILLVPPGEQGRRLPLVIQSYPWYMGEFLCDSGPEHDPSFIPQPLAGAGVMYLIRTIPGRQRRKEEQSHYPKEYPGQIGEAAFRMEFADSAVDYLDNLGRIDRDKVGIIGFSRAEWYTHFTLTHSKLRYRAATLVDGLDFSLGEYWLYPASVSIYANMYGGGPSGKSLQNWLDYCISFNLDRIRTPILMEVMGYGEPYRKTFVPPLNLATHLELFTGLNRLNKPVELYYYPTEGHQPEHPQARLASLQRNLDWYRFWLQGYERPNPEDPDQYDRWRKLEAMQNEVVRPKNADIQPEPPTPRH